MLDLCAGTGCIGLGILSLLHTRVPGLRVRAVDINRRARSLALKTVRLNSRLTRLPKLPLLENSGGFEYRIADILDVGNVDAFAGAEEVFDVVVANPPYISVPALARDTSRSARCFEPRDALVPPLQSTGGVGLRGEETGDVFYSHILRIARRQQAKIVVMEVADSEQAWRVIGIVQEIERMEEEGFRWDVKEIWCDEIDVLGMDRSSGTGQGEGGIGVLGSGHGRAVVLAYGWGRHVL